MFSDGQSAEHISAAMTLANCRGDCEPTPPTDAPPRYLISMTGPSHLLSAIIKGGQYSSAIESDGTVRDIIQSLVAAESGARRCDQAILVGENAEHAAGMNEHNIADRVIEARLNIVDQALKSLGRVDRVKQHPL